jgi:sulfite reductase (NADPH) flavoprotein alpha-component
VSRDEARSGTGSSFVRRLVEGAGDAEEIPVRVVRAPRFRLPDDSAAPIVMFAGGAGIAPFRAFIAARSALAQPPETWLFFSTRAEANVELHRREFAEHISSGWLHFIAAVTSGAAGRDRSAIRDDIADHAADLLALIQDRGAYVYSCGSAGFASSAADAMQSALARALSSPQQALHMMRRLIGQGRYQQDVFTSYRAELAAPVLFDASEVALHNDDEHGYWMTIDGAVYDVTEFAHRHPGGRAIIVEHAGRDATKSYRTVEHHLDPEIEAMLGMYKIGMIRRLEFGSRWCIAVGPKGLVFVSLHDVFRAWVRMLHLVVEVENAVRHDFSILETVTVGGDDVGTMTPLKARLLLEAHERFLTIYLPSLFGRPLDELWSATVALVAPQEDVGRMRRDLDAAPDPAASGELAEARAALECGDLKIVAGLRQKFEHGDREFLAALKRTISQGVSAFERYGQDTVERGGCDLLAATTAIPSLRKALA